VIRHEATDTILAEDVERADSWLAQLRGLRGRRLDDGEALVLEGDRAARRAVDMLGVPAPLDVLWLTEGVVQRVATLRPWVGVGMARAETIVELPAGVAGPVSVGDRVSASRR